MDEGITKMLSIVISIMVILAAGLLAFKYLSTTNKPTVSQATLQATNNFAGGKYYTTLSINVRVTGGSAPYNITSVTIATDKGTITIQPNGNTLTANLPTGVSTVGNIQGNVQFNGQDSITLIVQSPNPLHITGGTVNVIDSNGNTASATLSILST